jgi:hypothetical protein
VHVVGQRGATCERQRAHRHESPQKRPQLEASSQGSLGRPQCVSAAARRSRSCRLMVDLSIHYEIPNASSASSSVTCGHDPRPTCGRKASWPVRQTSLAMVPANFALSLLST